ncbi:MAG: hypothetical protein ACOCZK_02405 [Planctomycetota bacterium]
MQTLLRALIYLVCVATGAALLVLAIVPGLGDELTGLWALHGATPGTRLILTGAGLVYVLLPCCLLARHIASRRYAREISYTTELGTVSVSLIAVEEALTRTVEQELSVKKVQLRLYEDRVKRVLVIEAVLTLWDDGDVTGINRRCQDLLRRRFAELMPERTGVQVHLTVHRLNQRRASSDTTADREVESRVRTRVTEPEATPAEGAPTPEPLPRESRLPLPGLAATRGGTGVEDGAALLARRRQDGGLRIESDPRLPVSVSLNSEPPQAQEIAEVNLEAEESITATGGDDEAVAAADEYADLYRGPAYPVADPDDEEV